jgi:PqqD family protein of HPr-rel-A system
MARLTTASAEMLRLNPVLAWRELDGEFVVYDEASGNTFLVSGMAARIFAAMREAPIARAMLAARFCPADPAEPASEAAEIFAANLAFLKELEAILPGASD